MITKHSGGKQDFHTTSDFWECECDKGYIHSNLKYLCSRCGVRQEDAPEARVEEILDMIGSPRRKSKLTARRKSND